MWKLDSALPARTGGMPDSDAVEREVPAAEREQYREWLASPSISTYDRPEMVIAWNLAARLGLHPSRALRSLRKERGYLAMEMEAVNAAVAADPDLVFRRGPDYPRLVAFREDGGRLRRLFGR